MNVERMIERVLASVTRTLTRSTPRRAVIAAAIGLGVALGTAAPADAAQLKLLSSFNSTQKPTYAVLERYLQNVAKIGGDTIKITISGPEVV